MVDTANRQLSVTISQIKTQIASTTLMSINRLHYNVKYCKMSSKSINILLNWIPFNIQNKQNHEFAKL